MPSTLLGGLRKGLTRSRGFEHVVGQELPATQFKRSLCTLKDWKDPLLHFSDLSTSHFGSKYS